MTSLNVLLALSDLDQSIIADAAYLTLAVFLLLVSKIALVLFTPFAVEDEFSSKDNPAFGISLIGYYLGVLIVFIGTIYEETTALQGTNFAINLLYDAGWALAGIVMLNISRVVLDRVVLRGFSTRKEIVEDRNAGVGAVEFGTYIASALIVAGALTGQDGTWLTTLVFFLLGQVSLCVFGLVYQKVTTRYDIHEELERDNVAAGIAYGGNLIAMGVIIMRGSAGDFVSWEANLSKFGAYLIVALGLLTVGHFVIDRVFLPGRTLEEEIVEDRNVNAGYLEGGLLMGLAAIVAIAT